MNRPTRLHLAGLNRTVGNDSLLDRIQTLIVTVETLVVDRSDRAARVAANFLGSFDAAVLQGFFNLGDEFLRVDRRQREIEDTLDGNGQTDNQEDKDREHPCPTTLEELLHHHVVQAIAGELGFGSCSSLLRESVNSTQCEQGH